jgi:hypothetical protein
MPLLVAITLLLFSVSAQSATGVPTLDIRTTCRAAQGVDPRVQEHASYTSCMKDEQDALAELRKVWGTFGTDRRRMCSEEARIGGYPSYADLLTCLQLSSGGARITSPQQPGSHE